MQALVSLHGMRTFLLRTLAENTPDIFPRQFPHRFPPLEGSPQTFHMDSSSKYFYPHNPPDIPTRQIFLPDN